MYNRGETEESPTGGFSFYLGASARLFSGRSENGSCVFGKKSNVRSARNPKKWAFRHFIGKSISKCPYFGVFTS
jgi:hypothetical protein